MWETWGAVLKMGLAPDLGAGEASTKEDSRGRAQRTRAALQAEPPSQAAGSEQRIPAGQGRSWDSGWRGP